MMGTSPTCQHCAASPRHRWAPLFQQHTRGEENTLPIIRCCGESAHPTAGGQGSQQSSGPPCLRQGVSARTCTHRRAGEDERG